jgi:hypothetical protein
MTSPDDGPLDGPLDGSRDGPREPPQGVPDPTTGSDLPADFEAAWRAIVDNYGERPALVAPEEPAPAPPAFVDPGLFDRSHLDAFDADDVDDRSAAVDRHAEEHFVPPEPPPAPRGTPARRLAWGGLFLPPALMLLAVVLGWTFAPWAAMLLVVGFVGGFVFLVATMPRERGEGDDGAVV